VFEATNVILAVFAKVKEAEGWLVKYWFSVFSNMAAKYTGCP
jgi:hypothetical protein